MNTNQIEETGDRFHAVETTQRSHKSAVSGHLIEPVDEARLISHLAWLNMANLAKWIQDRPR